MPPNDINSSSPEPSVDLAAPKPSPIIDENDPPSKKPDSKEKEITEILEGADQQPDVNQIAAKRMPWQGEVFAFDPTKHLDNFDGIEDKTDSQNSNFKIERVAIEPVKLRTQAISRNGTVKI